MTYFIMIVVYLASVLINRFLYIRLQRISYDYDDDSITFAMVFVPLVGTVILLLVILAEYDFDDRSNGFNRAIEKFWNLFRPKNMRR